MVLHPSITAESHAETLPASVALLSKYLRVDQVVAGYPFGRSFLYEKLANGEIKSFVLRKRGNIRGIRLIDRDSLDSFLDRKAEEAQAVEANQAAQTQDYGQEFRGTKL